jgi:hypothetical protein
MVSADLSKARLAIHAKKRKLRRTPTSSSKLNARDILGKQSEHIIRPMEPATRLIPGALDAGPLRSQSIYSDRERSRRHDAKL